MTQDTADLRFAGYSFDIRRIGIIDWIIGLATLPLGGFGIGWLLVSAAKRIPEEGEEPDS